MIAASKFLLNLLRVKSLVKKHTSSLKPGSLIVANHVSTVDMPLIASETKTVFVTSMEVKNNPLTGLIAIIAGAIFVDRKSIKTLRNDITRIAKLLKAGVNVTVFPEATSSNGSTVLPFKAALFEAARIANAPVQPVAIQYNSPSTVGYYGDMSFITHILRLFIHKNIMANVTWLQQRHFIDTSAKEMAELCRSDILSQINNKNTYISS
jgi:1-acyl-sn-glycerol-3-phosphate acyltransferase